MNDVLQLYTKQTTEQSKKCLQNQIAQQKRKFSMKKKRIRSRITISKGTYKFYLLSSSHQENPKEEIKTIYHNNRSTTSQKPIERLKLQFFCLVAEKILEKSNESQNHVSNSHSWVDFEGEKKKRERKVSPEKFRMSIMIQTHVKEKKIIYIYGIDFLRNKAELN